MASQSQAKEAVYLYWCVRRHLDAAILTCVFVFVCANIHVCLYCSTYLCIQIKNLHSLWS